VAAWLRVRVRSLCPVDASPSSLDREHTCTIAHLELQAQFSAAVARRIRRDNPGSFQLSG
jgi:hypothetical protein